MLGLRDLHGSGEALGKTKRGVYAEELRQRGAPGDYAVITAIELQRRHLV